MMLLGREVVVIASVVAILGGFACSSQDPANSGTGGVPGIGGEFAKGVGGEGNKGVGGAGGTGTGGKWDDGVCLTWPNCDAGAGGNPGDGGLQGAPCNRVSDCASGLTCGYKAGDGCSAQGVCVPVTPQPGAAACGALTLHCGCDGVTTVYGGCNFFADYVPAPVMSGVFVCPADAGPSSDGGSSCTGWGGTGAPCCDGLVYMPSTSTALPGRCVKP